MAPAYSGYSNYYDPANSQAHAQQSYTHQTQRAPGTAEPSGSNNTQTTSHQSAYPSNTSYATNSWYNPAEQAVNATESRAAETLSHLSARDQGHGSSQGQTQAQGQTQGQGHGQSNYDGRGAGQYEPISWAASTYDPSLPAPTSSAAPSYNVQRTAGATPSHYPPQGQSQSHRTSDAAASYNASQSYQPSRENTYSSSSYANNTQSQTPAPTQTASSNPSRAHSAVSSQFPQPAAVPPSRANVPYQRPPSAQSRSAADRPSSTLNQPALPNTRQTRVPSATPSSVHQHARASSANNRTASAQGHHAALTEPAAPTTVDPSQVYDAWPEQQRKAQQAADQRRKAAEMLRHEIELREAEEKRRKDTEAQKQEATRVAEERRMREQGEAEAQLQRDMATRKQREIDASRQAAPQSTQSPDAAPAAAATQNEVETQMRAMFQKMRELNAKDPNMLARLWEEERRAHVGPGSTIAAAIPAPATGASALVPTKLPASAAPSLAATPLAKSSTTRNRPAAANKATKARPATSTAAPAPPPAVQHPTTAPAPAPTSPQQTATQIWPPGRKVTLAEAAAQWLRSRPENRAKNINTTKIVILLDSNPSYITLCESLEKQMGLVVDRAAFARALLHTVPDMMSKSSTTAAAVNVTPGQPLLDGSVKAAQHGTVTAATSAKAKTKTGNQNSTPTAASTAPTNGRTGITLTDMYRNAVTEPTVAYESNFSYDGSADPFDFGDAAPAPAVQSPYFPPNQQSQPPGPPQSHKALSKEETARKRTFAELVDLIGADEDSDKEMYPPPKMAYNAPYPGFGLAMSPLVNTADLMQGSRMDQARFGGPGATNATSTLQPLKSQIPQVATREAELKDKIVVQPILREKVARKSRYDPRTIARDVLLATGRHTEMRALNQHLMGMQDFLRDHSGGVEYHKYDLASIRWDLIDPGVPVVEKKVADVDVDMDADDEDEVLPAPAIASRRTVSHGDGTVSFVEIRTPGGIARLKTNAMKRGRKPKNRFPLGAGPLSSRPAGQSDAPRSSNSAMGAPANTAPRPRRQTQSNQAASTPQLNSQAVAGSGNGSGTPSSVPVGYAAFNQSTPVQYDENGKPIRRKGRPVGWRKNIHSKAAQGLAPSLAGPAATAPKKLPTGRGPTGRGPGRPPKASAPFVPAPEPEAEFNVYECKWKGCNAELHNLDTLRKHVLKIHGGKVNTNKRYECLWRGGGCSKPSKATMASGRGKEAAAEEEEQVKEFESQGQWLEHVEYQHLLPVARKLGDGPKNGLSDAPDSEQSEAYLSDAAGRVITPRAVASESFDDEDAAQQNTLLAPVMRRDVPRQRGQRLKDNALEDELKLQNLEARKALLGPFIDRGGARLANDERRRGLYDDEEFEGEVSADDGPE